jgi:hypothetical protein
MSLQCLHRLRQHPDSQPQQRLAAGAEDGNNNSAKGPMVSSEQPRLFDREAQKREVLRYPNGTKHFKA